MLIQPMRNYFYLLIFGLIFSAGDLFAQKVLPEFSITNNKGKISIRWLNNYPVEVKTISIQRSFDSTNNFSSISSVFNPQSIKNGFVDLNPPGNEMFYRLFIVFDSGVYIFSESQKANVYPLPEITRSEKSSAKKGGKSRKKVKSAGRVEKKVRVKGSKNKKSVNPSFKKNNSKEKPILIPKEEIFVYPSKRIYTGKDNNIVINLPGIKINKYVIKFFDEENKPLFELTKITEDYLIIEKMNFLRSGWFKFEIYENDILLEKNKFNIPKDDKIQ